MRKFNDKEPDLEQVKKWILDEKYNEVESGKFKVESKFSRDLNRYKKGEPLDYIIGWKDFLGCKIDLSKRPLIPRVETEFWVEKIITTSPLVPLKASDSLSVIKEGETGGGRILDMFSGSGCIGIAILKHIKNSRVDFVDVSKNCIEQIKINLKLNHVEGKVIQSDLFKKVPKNNDYDLILANPPYISSSFKLKKSVNDYEPSLALWAGEDGLDLIRKFLSQVKNYLAKGGEVYMEFGQGQKNEIEKIVRNYEFEKYEFWKDQYGKWRVLKIT